MAEGVVTFFIQKLYELLEQKVHLILEAEKEVMLLRDKLEWLRCFLKDADGRSNEDEQVNLWVSQIRDATYEAEDIIDEFILQVEQHHPTNVKQLQPRTATFMASITKCFVMVQQKKTLCDIGEKINNINTRLQRIEENKLKYGIQVKRDGRAPCNPWKKENRGTMVEELDVVGIEKEANIIAKMLMEGEPRRSVVSIVGMGGLGKTTLARKVYNRNDLKKHFQCYAWIYVSQEFNTRELLIEILRCLKGKEAIKEMIHVDKEELMEQVFDYLRGKRYLVVIDDIWKSDAWDSLAASLPDDGNESRILLTTRNKDVALHVYPRREPYELRLLTEDECFELLYKKAFPNDLGDGCREELKTVGREMVQKCNGLPLAVVVLGGLLSRKEPTFKEWTKVLKRISWELNEGKERISNILALSYNDLPYDLKSCFLQLGSFPEDSVINANDLIRIWVAEGFVKRRGDETLEDAAEDCLLELVHRSMVQVVKRNYDGQVKRCRIHDLLRDLAIKEAKEVKFLQVYGNANQDSDTLTTARRLAITHHDIDAYIRRNGSARQLRSLYCFTQYDERLGDTAWLCIHGRFKFLRVLHIEGVDISMLPSQIGNLIHLRYFLMTTLTNREFQRLPWTFSNLCSLQTLHIENGSVNIHEDLWKMKQLRHLKLELGVFPEKPQRVQLHKLTNLQILSMMQVGDWVRDDELGKLTCLTSLGVKGELSSYQSDLLSSIGKLVNLKKLKLWESNEDQVLMTIPLYRLQQLENLHLYGCLGKLPVLQDFPSSLAKLDIRDSKLEQDPLPMLGELSNLKILRLHRSYMGRKMTCSAKSFPKLQDLKIGKMDIEEWRVEEGAMINLRELGIRNCKKLMMIPDGLRHVTALQVLRLVDLSHDFLARVCEHGEDWHKIQHIPSVLIPRHRRTKR